MPGLGLGVVACAIWGAVGSGIPARCRLYFDGCRTCVVREGPGPRSLRCDEATACGGGARAPARCVAYEEDALPCGADADVDLLFHGSDVSRGNSKDFFSASWLMSVDRFRGLERDILDRINIVEDGVFRPAEQYRHDFAMTREWLAFSVEHLSRYWKGLNESSVAALAAGPLDAYATGAPLVDGAPLRDCICILPFMPFGDAVGHGSLTAISLAATLRSLRRVGVGRVVVVHSAGRKGAAVASAGRYLRGAHGDMDVAFVKLDADKTSTKFIAVNMPAAAIKGLHAAFAANDGAWLGRGGWKYVYLTEPDSLLVARGSTLPAVLRHVDAGRVLTPHRLQPLPHFSDGFLDAGEVAIPDSEDFPVTSVRDGGACYDLGDERPPGFFHGFGSGVNYGVTKWWMFGFKQPGWTNDAGPEQIGNFSLVKQMGLMRLPWSLGGSGLALAAGDEHARRCKPTCGGAGVRRDEASDSPSIRDARLVDARLVAAKAERDALERGYRHLVRALPLAVVLCLLAARVRRTRRLPLSGIAAVVLLGLALLATADAAPRADNPSVRGFRRPSPIPADCVLYFDGCDYCAVRDGPTWGRHAAPCTANACDARRAPRCVAFEDAAKARCAADDGADLVFAGDAERASDVCSRSWLMTVDTFRGLEDAAEDGALDARLAPGDVLVPGDVARTRDWLAFAVERFSGYWDALDVDSLRSLAQPYGPLARYAAAAAPAAAAPLRDCVCILPFERLERLAGPRARTPPAELAAAMLAAALRSLERAGVGRVVVVSAAGGPDAAELLRGAHGDTEVAFVAADAPTPAAAAVRGLRAALASDDGTWLGGRGWKYVLLASVEDVLVARASAVPALLRHADAGRVLCPRVLRPALHASDDVSARLNWDAAAPDTRDFPVLDVDERDGCYDLGDASAARAQGFMRLRHGSRVTLSPADDRGRRCSAVCEAPTAAPASSTREGLRLELREVLSDFDDLRRARRLALQLVPGVVFLGLLGLLAARVVRGRRR